MKILITKWTKIVQFVLRKLVKNKNFDYVINDQTPPPPPPVINRKHLETPPLGWLRNMWTTPKQQNQNNLCR